MDVERPELYTQHFNDSEEAMRGKSRQHVVESRQHVVDSIQGKKSLHTAYCLLPTKKNSLSTVYRLLSTEKKSLPTTYCILPTEKGFTLVELLITMTVFVLVIAAASQIFTGLLTQFKQQSKIAETNIEGIVGLEILRQDIAHAGYGLPWNVTGVIDSDSDGNLWDEMNNYLEADSVSCTPNPADFNDASTTIPRAPRAILSKNIESFSGCGANSVFNGSDYLVIKSMNVARNDTSQKWTYLYSGNTKKSWNPTYENLNNTDRIIVVSPGSTDTNSRALAVSGGNFFTRYDTTNGFAPTDATETRVIYGLDPPDPTSEPYNRRMPFNRAEYYIWRNSTSSATDEVPDRCATNTGVLRKAVISQADGQRQNPLPLLDCVANMQVIYCLDNDNDGDCEVGVGGSTDSYSDDISTQNAQWIRERVKQVRVYILAHEGQKDVNYTFNNFSCSVYDGKCITVGEFGMGRNFDLRTITDYLNYRWKLYTIIVKPVNLRGK